MTRRTDIPRHPRPAGRARRGPAGFTLIDAALATVIVGVAVTALLTLMARSTVSSAAAAELTTAVNLAAQIHELTERLPLTDAAFHWGMETGETLQSDTLDVEDLDGQTFDGANGTGPIDGASRQPIAAAAMPDAANWAQSVSVQSISSTDNSVVLNNDAQANPMMRVTVTITHFGKPIYATSWILVRTSPTGG